MQKLTIIPILFFMVATGYSQGPNWKEMNRFHGLANVVFHSAEAGNLKPTRDSAAVVLAAAKAWKDSPMPGMYNPKIIDPLLDKLVKECSDINDAVAAKKKDAVLKPLVAKAHDTFHVLLSDTQVSQ